MVPDVDLEIEWLNDPNYSETYKDHTKEQQSVIIIHRRSLYAASITWKVYTFWSVNCSLYKQVVFIYRWSLEQVSL